MVSMAAGGQILGRAPGEAPSKTSETAKTDGRAVFEVFEGSVPGRIPKIEAAREEPNLGKYPIGGAIKNIKKMPERTHPARSRCWGAGRACSSGHRASEPV
jgi:hypothetical protein